MRAIQLIRTDPFESQLVELDQPAVGAGMCLVKISAAALNRRDQWIMEGLYPGIKTGITLGSDAAGEVVEGNKEWVGKKVVINPNVHWGSDPKAQSLAYQILGMPVNGTLTDYLVVSPDRLALMPDHLDAIQAASVPLAGMTAYRACFTKGQIKSDQHVLVTGAGGGVAQFAIAFSMAAGASVFVTSGSDKKIERTVQIGARGGYNYQDADWTKKALKEGAFDVVIDGAGGASVNQYLKILKPGGRLVMYGSTTGRTPELDTFRLFWSQVSIHGSTMATDAEFTQMLDFVSQHKIEPVIDAVYGLADFPNAFARFAHPDHFGKIVLTTD